MKCEGKFVYKGIETKEGGEFTNEKGVLVKYEPTYQITVDDLSDDKIVQRKFKFPVKNSTLADKFKSYKPYSNIDITFEVSLYNTNARIVPVDTCYTIEDLED